MKDKDKTNKERDKMPPKSRDSHGENSIPGINTPGIELPAFNPPIPNRAWTAMRNGMDIDELSPEEKRNLYYGKDGF